MIFARKIKLIVTKEEAHALDGQSKMCNWLYNQLLEATQEDYRNGNENKLLSGRNLRNQVPIMKKENPFLKTIYSSPLKNTAVRVKDSYKNFFNGSGHPNFRSWKKKWFSLLYEEPFKGYSLDKDKKTLRLSFGKDENNKQIRLNLKMSEPLLYRDKKEVVSLRIVKEHNSYYAVFTLKREAIQKVVDVNSWIAFDPNHKNLMVGVDNHGHSIEFARTTTMQYWDKCKRKSVYVPTYEGRGYWQPSRQWTRYNDAIERASVSMREQNKQEVFNLSNAIVSVYDYTLMGDYAPSTDTAKYKNQHRPMLNQTYIGKIRTTMAWVAERSGKKFEKVDEYHTTKECPFCGFMEPKDPSIRVYTCPECGTTYYRDIGSAINMAVKGNKLLRSGYSDWKVAQPEYTAHWDWRESKWIAVLVADESNESDFSLGLRMRKKVRNIAQSCVY